jgi:hypothetical protein
MADKMKYIIGTDSLADYQIKNGNVLSERLNCAYLPARLSAQTGIVFNFAPRVLQRILRPALNKIRLLFDRESLTAQCATLTTLYLIGMSGVVPGARKWQSASYEVSGRNVSDTGLIAYNTGLSRNAQTTAQGARCLRDRAGV